MKRKKISYLILSILMMLLFAACGKSTETTIESSVESTVEEAQEAAEETTGDTEEEFSEETVTEDTTADVSPSSDIPTFYGSLQVTEGKLTDSAGKTVQLQGLSTHGIAWFPDYVNQDVLHQMKEEWGCNVFRIAMYTDEYGGYAVSGDSEKEKLKALVDKGVQAAIAEDMYVIIDWHILRDTSPLQHKEQALAFFEEMSQKYGDVPNVIYEICNEPNGGTSWEDVRAYANEVIPIIRKNSPDSIIIVGTPTWCQEVDKAAQNPLTEYENIMYSLHFYASTHKDDLRNRAKNAAESGLALFVSEFGICDASGNGVIDEAEADKWITFLNENSISYCMWGFCNKNESASFINSGCSKISGFEEQDLAQSGKWFVNRPGRNDFYAGEDAGKQNPEDDKEQESGKQNPEDDRGQKNSVDTHTDKTAVNIALSNSWNDGNSDFYQYGLNLSNDTGKKVTNWTITITFSSDIAVSSGWCGIYETQGKELIIRPETYNAAMEANGQIKDIGFIITGQEGLEVADAHVSFVTE